MVFGKATFGWVLGFSLATPSLAQAPPPPPRVLEFANPTLREHSLSARCAGGSASLTWSYDGHDVVLREFTFAGRPVAELQRDQLQQWMSEIPGDVFVFVECDSSAATLSLLSAESTGSGITPRITVQFENGTLSEVFRFDMPRP